MEESLDINNILNRISNDIFSDFVKSSSNCTLKLDKENIITKITKNISIIKNLYDNNIINETDKKNIYYNLKNINFIENTNNTINNTINNLTQYKKIRKELGYIIFDIYHYSGYHVLMSNIPSKVLTIIDDNNKKYNINDIDDIEIINSESIYDTINHYIGDNSVNNVFQVSENNYLVKMKNIYDSKKLCDILNKMQIGDNIIKVELLNPIPIIVENIISEPIIVEKIIIEQVDSDSTNMTESVDSKSVDSDKLLVSEVLVSEVLVSEVLVSNKITSSIDLDKEEDENIIYISRETSKGCLETIQPLKETETSFTGTIFNKISNLFSFFRKS